MSFHVRRKDREITDPDALKFVLKSTKYVTIALCMNNDPYLVSLSHGYDEAKNCLYFHCAPEGRKITYAKANNNVWGQAMLDYGVTDECDYAYTSVHFQGKLYIIDNLTEKQHDMEILVRQLSATPEAKLAKISPEKLAKTTMARINITCMIGKKHQNPKAASTS
jgi:nitroimidazol reductase NimA-like FMN-containing flavoprotein (pyridoxamine 5'-phosphate oxidase superfamily)